LIEKEIIFEVNPEQPMRQKTGIPQFTKVQINEAKDHRDAAAIVDFDTQRKTVVGAETEDPNEKRKIEKADVNFIGIEPPSRNPNDLINLSKMQMGIQFLPDGRLQVNKIGSNPIRISYGISWSPSLDKLGLKVGEQFQLTGESPIQIVDSTNLQLVMPGNESYDVVVQFTRQSRAAVFLRKKSS